jgi:hypothetical protein
MVLIIAILNDGKPLCKYFVEIPFMIMLIYNYLSDIIIFILL